MRRTLLLLTLLLAGCATPSTLKLCQGRLQPINPPNVSAVSP